ncbi:ABC transporter ATP-binding protein [Pectinatus haikarae]|uniref:ABC transporter ATP-binding protein n=1 Tax=Pectinatus haikarae TaxID=349096 RepID=UPI0018C4EEBB
MSEYAIEVNNVSMCFNLAKEKVDNLKELFIKKLHGNLSFDKFYAINDLSFKIRKGESFAIVGSNGSGKSTILKIISGILKPTRGNVEVHGSIAPMIELGSGFDMDLTARENIFLNGAVLGYSHEFMQDHFNEIIEFSELGDFIDVPVKNFSSGMVARLGFAIMTIVKPDILIVDEILSVGDQYFKQKSERRMRELMAGGTTIVLVSHSMEQVCKICDKAIWLEKGILRCSGSVDEVYGHYLGELYKKRQSTSVRVGDKKTFRQAQILSEEEYLTQNKEVTSCKSKNVKVTGDVMMADMTRGNDKYETRLYSPTYITKVFCGGEFYYFIVDSLHHRVIFNRSIDEPIEKWKTIAADIATPVTVACDGDLIILNESGYGNLRVYKYIYKDIFNYSQCISGIIGARNVIFDKTTKTFYELNMQGNILWMLKNDDGYVSVRKKFSIDTIKNLYIRSIRILDGVMWIVANNGIIFSLNYIDNTFELLERHDVSNVISDLNDIFQFDNYFYLTSGDGRCIRFRNMRELVVKNYENLTKALLIDGIPYRFEFFDNRIFLSIMHQSSKIISFKLKNDIIQDVEKIFDFGQANKADILRFCCYPG